MLSQPIHVCQCHSTEAKIIPEVCSNRFGALIWKRGPLRSLVRFCKLSDPSWAATAEAAPQLEMINHFSTTITIQSRTNVLRLPSAAPSCSELALPRAGFEKAIQAELIVIPLYISSANLATECISLLRRKKRKMKRELWSILAALPPIANCPDDDNWAWTEQQQLDRYRKSSWTDTVSI